MFDLRLILIVICCILFVGFVGLVIGGMVNFIQWIGETLRGRRTGMASGVAGTSSSAQGLILPVDPRSRGPYANDSLRNSLDGWRLALSAGDCERERFLLDLPELLPRTDPVMEQFFRQFVRQHSIGSKSAWDQKMEWLYGGGARRELDLLRALVHRTVGPLPRHDEDDSAFHWVDALADTYGENADLRRHQLRMLVREGGKTPSYGGGLGYAGSRNKILRLATVSGETLPRQRSLADPEEEEETKTAGTPENGMAYDASRMLLYLRAGIRLQYLDAEQATQREVEICHAVTTAYHDWDGYAQDWVAGVNFFEGGRSALEAKSTRRYLMGEGLPWGNVAWWGDEFKRRFAEK